MCGSIATFLPLSMFVTGRQKSFLKAIPVFEFINQKAMLIFSPNQHRTVTQPQKNTLNGFCLVCSDFYLSSIMIGKIIGLLPVLLYSNGLTTSITAFLRLDQSFVPLASSVTILSLMTSSTFFIRLPDS